MSFLSAFLKKKNWSPWPVGIVIYFTSFFILVVIFAFKASGVRFDLVSKDYYARELDHDNLVAAAQRADQLSPAIGVEVEGQTLTVAVPEVHLASFDGPGTIVLYRPSDARADRRHDWPAVARHPIDLSDALPGRYEVQLSWTMGGKAYYHSVPIDAEGP